MQTFVENIRSVERMFTTDAKTWLAASIACLALLLASGCMAGGIIVVIRLFTSYTT